METTIRAMPFPHISTDAHLLFFITTATSIKATRTTNRHTKTSITLLNLPSPNHTNHHVPLHPPSLPNPRTLRPLRNRRPRQLGALHPILPDPQHRPHLQMLRRRHCSSPMPRLRVHPIQPTSCPTLLVYCPADRHPRQLPEFHPNLPARPL